MDNKAAYKTALDMLCDPEVWTDSPDDAPSYRDSYEWTVTDGK